MTGTTWQWDALLADGSAVHVRPITPADANRLVAFHDSLSPETVHYRFFSPHPHLSQQEVVRFTEVDHVDRDALLALRGDDIVGVARYDRLPDSDEAEVAFVVADAYQGQGVGSLLLEDLAAVARTRGVAVFVAETLADNRRMLEVFRQAGFPTLRNLDHEVVRVSFPIAPVAEARAVADRREHSAEARSISRLLAPRSVAVVGASRRPGSVGNAALANVLAGGFTGPVYPVNPTAAEVEGLAAFASVAEIPNPVDLAVIAVPAVGVLDVVEDCGAKGVHGLVVLSAGFAETGVAGVERQRRLVERARAWGMRVVGPNCIGVVNTDPLVSLDATFAAVRPRPGNVGFLSQSGALGIAVLDAAARRRLGVSSFVSVGNKADVSGNDLLQYWEDDPRTDVVLLYLESFGNPRKFARLARRISRQKPVVAVKSGRTTVGSRAARSHTAALASPDTAVDALFRQAGVVRVDTLPQLLDVGTVLSSQPPPAGRRLAIVGNSGGPAILAADACEGLGLDVPELTAATQEILGRIGGPGAAVANPVDLLAGVDAPRLGAAITAVLDDTTVDAVLVVFTPTRLVTAVEAVAAIEAAAAGATKPVAATVLTAEPGVEGTVPVFGSPEEAVTALARAADYAAFRDRPDPAPVAFDDLDSAAAHAVVRGALATRPDGDWLDPPAVATLLRAFGIPVLETVAVGSGEEAAQVASRVGLPVVLKAAGPDIVHKSDVGGVRLGLTDAEAVRSAYDAMRQAIGPAMTDAVVQPMAKRGVEVIVGVVDDPSFGPLVMFGLGGTAAELLADRAFRILPMGHAEVGELVRSIRTAPLLFGYRGAPPADVDALEEVLLRVAALAEQVPELAEMDLNPVVVSTEGVQVVDARARVRPVAPPEPAVRRLRPPS